MMMAHVRDYGHGALCAGPTAEAMAKASEVLLSSAGGQVAYHKSEALIFTKLFPNIVV